MILNVGRFFDPRFGHSKKQLELHRHVQRSGIDGWTSPWPADAMSLNRDYALAARRAARRPPGRRARQRQGELVQQLLAAASIYWHAGGFGEDPQRHPDRFEHFGITVVEAMAAGAVPLVFGAAGPAEIVEHGVNGFHWRTTDELIALTKRLIADPGHARRWPRPPKYGRRTSRRLGSLLR